jgi:hypothetical protein
MGGDFWVKIKVFLYLGVHLGGEIPYAYAQSNFKEDYFFEFGPKKFFSPEAFETICLCQ